MSDYTKYLKMAKGDAPDPLHAAILDTLLKDAPKSEAKLDSGGGPNDPPPPPGGGG